MIDLKILSGKEYEKLKEEKEFVISYGFHESPFGKCLVGLFGERICHISFVNSFNSANLDVLKLQWPGSTLVNDQKLTMDFAEKIFDAKMDSFKVLLKGTAFEAKVWKALTNIPKGETVSYEDVAIMTGCNRAVRAAANAVAKNLVSYLIPCHRVIKKNGSVHRYQWGSLVKKKILEFEKCNLKNNLRLRKFW